MAALTVYLETRLPDFMLSLAFETGDELVAIVGGAGSGKSVILRSIAGVYIPDSGAITIGGVTVFSSGLGINVPASQRHVAYVPLSHQLFPHLSVAENIAFPLRKRRDASAGDWRRVDDLIDLLGLERWRNRLPEDLPVLESQRVAQARALVIDPEALLMDDPFGALEIATRRDARAEFATLRRQLGVPTLFATGELEEAYEIADRIALLDNGRLLQLDSPRALLTRPVNRRVAEIVRSVNVFPGRVVDVFGERCVVDTRFGALKVDEAGGAASEVDVVIRPEHLRILERDESRETVDNVLDGRFIDDAMHGSLHALVFAPDQSPSDAALRLFVEDLAWKSFSVALGEPVRVSLPPRALHLMPRLPEDDTAIR